MRNFRHTEMVVLSLTQKRPSAVVWPCKTEAWAKGKICAGPLEGADLLKTEPLNGGRSEKVIEILGDSVADE